MERIGIINEYSQKKYSLCSPDLNKIKIEEHLISERSKQLFNSFKCLICLDLVVDPIECKKCFSLFCKNHIEEWKKTKNSCPNKCKKFEGGELSHIKYKNILNELEIKCQNYECNEIVQYENYKKHFLSCLKGNLYKCLGDNCNFQDSEENIKHHVEICELQRVACEYCSIKLVKINIEDHQNFCEYKILKCEYCSIPIMRKNFKEHTREECCKKLIVFYEEKMRLFEEREQEFKKLLDTSLISRTNSNSIFKKILTSGYNSENLDNNEYIIQPQLSNEYFGEIRANSNLENWVLIEFIEKCIFDTIEFSGEMFKSDQLFKLLIFKVSIDGRLWREVEKQNLLIAGDKISIVFETQMIVNYLMICARGFNINFNYLKISDSPIKNKYRNFGKTSIENAKVIKKENTKLINMQKSEHGDGNFIKCIIGDRILQESEILELTNSNTYTGLKAFFPEEIIIEFDKVYDINEIIIAGCSKSIEKLWIPENGSSSVVYTSIDNANWFEAGILPSDYSDSIHLVKLLRSNAKYIRFKNNFRIGISYLKILPFNINFYSDNNHIFLDFSFSGPFCVDKEIIGDNNLDIFNDALLQNGFCCNKPGYLLLELKNVTIFNCISLGGYGGNTDIWYPAFGKGADIFCSKTGLIDSWTNICKIPLHYTNDLINIELHKMYEAKFIKIINNTDLLGISYLEFNIL